MLSVVFHPQYATNGYFFVSYTDLDGNSRVERYHVSSNPDVADASSMKLILGITQPFPNHNGGLMVFGTDGKLYLGFGDGGSGGDPQGNGQKLTTLLGKMLRIDVDAGDPYAIPDDNPFRGRSDARPEIWAYGLRNPWRWSFDWATDRLYLADVGQEAHEEVNVVGAHEAGLNYGWNIMEGASCFKTSSCDQTGLVQPVIDYDHGQGCSVTGGYVYRGEAIPELTGLYFYSDFCGGWLRSFRYVGGAAVDRKQWSIGSIGNVRSFGIDRHGEMYILSGGQVLKIVRGS
jgi:glucose/arabinose dehydrogenase